MLVIWDTRSHLGTDHKTSLFQSNLMNCLVNSVSYGWEEINNNSSQKF